MADFKSVEQMKAEIEAAKGVNKLEEGVDSKVEGKSFVGTKDNEKPSDKPVNVSQLDHALKVEGDGKVIAGESGDTGVKKVDVVETKVIGKGVEEGKPTIKDLEATSLGPTNHSGVKGDEGPHGLLHHEEKKANAGVNLEAGVNTQQIPLDKKSLITLRDILKRYCSDSMAALRAEDELVRFGFLD